MHSYARKSLQKIWPCLILPAVEAESKYWGGNSILCKIQTRKKIDNLKLVVRVFANGPIDWGSIPCQVIPKIQKILLDVVLLNTQHYKVRIKGKVGQSRERICAFPYTSV